MLHLEKKRSWISVCIASLFVTLSIYATYTAFSILDSTNKQLENHTQSLIIDLVRTENHSTHYQQQIKHYLRTPSEALKLDLAHLNGILKSRKSLFLPEALNPEFPIDFIKSITIEIIHYDNALTELSALLSDSSQLRRNKKLIAIQHLALEASMTYIYTETIMALQTIRSHKKAALTRLSISILTLSTFLVLALLAVFYFTLGLHQQSEVFEHLSMTDGLTSLSNKRKFDTLFESLFENNKRTGAYLSLLILDIDHFKKYNDTFGHRKGDQSLISVARSISECLQRAADESFRLGGEEFGCLITSNSEQEVNDLSEKIRQTIQNLQIDHPKNKPSKLLTVSIGCAIAKGNNFSNINNMYERADQALYEAKSMGRNRVIVTT